MVAQEELRSLLARKRALIAESEAIRDGLCNTCADIAVVTERWGERVQQFRDPKFLLIAGAAAAGLFLARKSGKGIGLAAKVMAGWRLLSTARDLWRGWQAARQMRP
jgi:hypothetical protein